MDEAEEEVELEARDWLLQLKEEFDNSPKLLPKQGNSKH